MRNRTIYRIIARLALSLALLSLAPVAALAIILPPPTITATAGHSDNLLHNNGSPVSCDPFSTVHVRLEIGQWAKSAPLKCKGGNDFIEIDSTQDYLAGYQTMPTGVTGTLVKSVKESTKVTLMGVTRTQASLEVKLKVEGNPYVLYGALAPEGREYSPAQWSWSKTLTVEVPKKGTVTAFSFSPLPLQATKVVVTISQSHPIGKILKAAAAFYFLHKIVP